MKSIKYHKHKIPQCWNSYKI